jgi:hypothetical protein
MAQRTLAFVWLVAGAAACARPGREAPLSKGRRI